MFKHIFCVVTLFAVSVVMGHPAEAGAKKTYLPTLPYESYFAKYRGDRAVLKFNDFSGKIKAQRIKKLLRSGPVLGDRVLLDNNLAVYFPEGYIVSSTLRLDAFRPKNGVTAKRIKSSHDLEENPDYQLVEQMDQHLGKVCAEINLPNQIKARLRKSPDGILSLVKHTPGRFDRLVGTQSRAYEITSALKPSYLSKEREVIIAAMRCI
ncbi:MAG: hypothetical protein HWE30_04290 [Methylocystaceae bacterium]|nr:hypothetical protein [Methylocystaceae bacterium]